MRLAGQAALLLGWRPDDFWNSTPDELACVLAAMGGDAGPDATTLDALMALHPDDEGKRSDG